MTKKLYMGGSLGKPENLLSVEIRSKFYFVKYVAIILRSKQLMKLVSEKNLKPADPLYEG
jgi:hypothetical protein